MAQVEDSGTAGDTGSMLSETPPTLSDRKYARRWSRARPTARRQARLGTLGPVVDEPVGPTGFNRWSQSHAESGGSILLISWLPPRDHLVSTAQRQSQAAPGDVLRPSLAVQSRSSSAVQSSRNLAADGMAKFSASTEISVNQSAGKGLLAEPMRRPAPPKPRINR
jgi:hypothetical protein